MFDLLSIIILLVAIVVFLNRWLFGFGAKRNYKTALKRLHENLVKYQEHTNRSKIEEEVIQKTTAAITKLEEMHEMFLHLEEKYRHALNQRRKIANDWLTYTRLVLKALEYEMDFAMLSDEKLLANVAEKFRADRIRLEEIEKRYKKLLNK